MNTPRKAPERKEERAPAPASALRAAFLAVVAFFVWVLPASFFFPPPPAPASRPSVESPAPDRPAPVLSSFPSSVPVPSPFPSPKEYSFGVLSQRSAVLTARYWNPILDHASKKAGVRLVLKVAKSADASNASIEAAAYDFVYSNTIFSPRTAPAGYEPFLKPKGQIHGQIVVLEGSPVQAAEELEGRRIGFPSKGAFVAYAVPSRFLEGRGISAEAVFGGNQEGVMARLKAGGVDAAAVNDRVWRAYASREGVRWRALWESDPYPDLPISFHPRVPREVMEKVRQAFLSMAEDPECAELLEGQARLMGLEPPFGFEPASRSDYGAYVAFYAPFPSAAAAPPGPARRRTE